MGAAKAFWEEVALREFGVITDETLEKALPIAQAELDEITGLRAGIEKGGTTNSCEAHGRAHSHYR